MTARSDLYGCPENFRESPITPTATFAEIFNGLLFRSIPRMCTQNWKFVASWDNSDYSFGLRLRTPNLGEGEAVVGSGMVPFERAFVTSYRLSIVTFPLSLRVSDMLPLLWTSTPLFPTPPLVSPKFPHVPLGQGGWLLGYEEQRCRANCQRN